MSQWNLQSERLLKRINKKQSFKLVQQLVNLQYLNEQFWIDCHCNVTAWNTNKVVQFLDIIQLQVV